MVHVKAPEDYKVFLHDDFQKYYISSILKFLTKKHRPYYLFDEAISLYLENFTKCNRGNLTFCGLKKGKLTLDEYYNNFKGLYD